MNPNQAQIDELGREATRWTLFALVGFVFGVAIFVGPVAWMKSNSLRGQLTALGAPDHGGVRATRLVAIATTALSALALVAILVVVAGIKFGSTY